LSTLSSDPWQAPSDESYWHRLFEQAESDKSTDDVPSAHYLDVVSQDLYYEDAGPALIPSAPPSEDTQHVPLDTIDAASIAENALERDWRRAYETQRSGARVNLRVSGYNRGGLLVRFGEIQGFVPASQLRELPKDLNSHMRQTELAQHVGRVLDLRIIELDRQRNRLIFSERASKTDTQGQDLLETLKPGEVRTGRVTNICGFGAFVDLGGVEGFIHISEFSWGRVNHPSDVLQIRDETDVYVLRVEPLQGRVSLSLKRLKPDPWTMIEERYQVGNLVEGEVTNVVSFGAFVRVEEGMEGLIHISELAEGNFLHPRNVVKEGDRVTARIIRIDSADHRLGLSLRQSPQTGSSA
jgi:small subunit ribosomal protein S1